LIRSIQRLEEYRDDPELLRRIDETRRDAMGESARTVLELYIATHCGQLEPEPTVRSKFAQAIAGADMPEHEEAHSARDIQFELYLWGLINASGNVCRFAEPPDLVCDYGGEAVGIAAKRIWSLEQARKRLSIAAEQIASSGLRGFIAVNAQEYLTADAGVADLTTKGQAISDALRRLHGHLPHLAKKEHVMGLFVGGTVYRWDISDDGSVAFDLTAFHQWLLVAEEGPEEVAARQFSSAQQQGLAKWMAANL
jgi:hypothetical protein